MARYACFLFCSFSVLSILSLAKEEGKINPRCQFFPCGKLGIIGFPFSNRTNPECGLMIVDNCEGAVQKIQLAKEGPWYNVISVAQDISITLDDQVFQDHLYNHRCESLRNMSFPSSPLLSFQIISNMSIYNCTHKLDSNSNLTSFNLTCKDDESFIYYNHPDYESPSLPTDCSLIQLPLNQTRKSDDLFDMLTSVYSLRIIIPIECVECVWSGGQCQSHSRGKFHCSNIGGGDKKLKLGLGIGIGGGLAILITLYIIHYCSKQKYASADIHSGNNSSGPSSKSDFETGTVYFGVPIFSYKDLAEATKDFNREKELGDGGFGTVYYGKLKDGREVAVKRLYENNYRRVEQFMNEVEILTRLRHKNLVSLYGCTSRYSQGLLLVYEFVPNGTVADHLYDRAKPGFLTWPVRMNVAIETASALAYLHASDIIHRDVKTTNILLDSNCCVKVADFGLSRLFPLDVTHVSTAPQGTPGYVDPEYHQCYQLTDKSDVYSFGVVLIELISSMPAVDMTRHRQEINLSNFAVNKIQKCAFDELIDPCLGYQSDDEVRRMTTSVAELAFLCLQQDKEMRPSMEDVFEELKRIRSGDSRFENYDENEGDNEVIQSSALPPSSPPYNVEDSLLKNISLTRSPISVTAKWVSSSSTTTTNASCG